MIVDWLPISVRILITCSWVRVDLTSKRTSHNCNFLHPLAQGQENNEKFNLVHVTGGSVIPVTHGGMAENKPEPKI